ncbi:MAG: hypothetical protein QOG99_2652, partial [Frankiales bacterium]|nr:hypothetical protein [Frankiales bacterium]
MRRAPLAVLCTTTLLLSSGCAARFARSDGNDSTSLSQGGLPAAQGGTTGTTGGLPRADTTGGVVVGAS